MVIVNPSLELGNGMNLNRQAQICLLSLGPGFLLGLIDWDLGSRNPFMVGKKNCLYVPFVPYSLRCGSQHGPMDTSVYLLVM